MFNFILSLQAVTAAALIGVILVQRSEGGGLGMGGGGGPAGLLSARGAANLLTRATAILAILFVSLSIALAAVATMENRSEGIDDSLSQAAREAAQASTASENTSDSNAPPMSSGDIGGLGGFGFDNSGSATTPAGEETPPAEENNR